MSRISKVFFTLLAMVCAAVMLWPASGAAAPGTQVYLPVFIRDNSNPVHNGTATWYYATGDGACVFGPSPGDLMVAAMNHVEYGNAGYCGAYLQVTGPKGSVMVRVVDLCPDEICGAGHLDLSQQAFAAVADLDQGYIPITWQVVSPDMDGPIAYYFMADSNPWWTAVQIRNHRNPIASLEYWNGSAWIELRRENWNFFIREDGENHGPYTFRVTDAYGNALVDSGIPHTPGGSTNGAAQFPYGP